ncbi:MAG: hypothetical protein K0Q89_29 [Thermomicrobiales bacterium]|jgi:hypothetical protein|nr:hypothetical protein [Thermomicrobiales bacterium]
MTKRRTAERAVIEAAVLLEPTVFGFWSRVAKLEAAVTRLKALDLEPATATRTISLPLATSEAAAQYMSKSAHRVVGRVFAQILLAYQQGSIGLTTDAIEQRLSRSHQSVSPRVTDLRDQGWIEDSGKTRATRYGQQATVWKPTDAAIEAARHVERWSW